jgi:hypothetical protein
MQNKWVKDGRRGMRKERLEIRVKEKERRTLIGIHCRECDGGWRKVRGR